MEPFLGSGAVFFHVREKLRPRRAILSDGNEELINVWQCVQKDVEALIRKLSRHGKLHSQQHYYDVRGQDPGQLSRVERAARILYLNRTCFNGLYRVNRSGRFNVPMGSYPRPRILDSANLRAVSAALKKVRLKTAHFRETLHVARKGDFIYFDPPYHPVSATSQFTSYSARDGKATFDEDDQVELADVFARLARRGCRLMLSNSDCDLVRRLFRRFWIYGVSARRSINSRGDRRGKVREVVILSYQAEAGEGTPPLVQA